MMWIQNGERKMKTWIRSMLCLLLVLSITFSLAVTAFATAELQDDAPHDFVILLDCSGSQRASDPKNLCLEACKSFVDLLPSRNTRVAVLGFGYTDGTSYTYSSDFDPAYTGDAPWVHVLVPMSYLDSEADRDEFKKTVETVYFQKKEQGMTPIGQAVSAGLDTLKQSGSAEGKACVILITDGIDVPYMRYFYPAEAAPDAAEREWPIYCIGLNYNCSDPNELNNAKDLLKEYCTISGNTTLGSLSCSTPEEVYSSFIQIFRNFYNLNGETQWLVLPADTSFEVPAMTSEAAVTVFGAGVESVKLTHAESGEEYTITKSSTDKKMIAVVEEDAYVSIRMIVPTEGTWNVHLEGKGGVEVQFSETDIREMDIDMVTNTLQEGTELTKKDRIRVDACFAYGEHEVHNNGFYNANPATLVVRSGNGTTREFDMEATKDGYTYELALSEIPSGFFELQVSVKHSMFRDGVKLSNVASYKTEPKPLVNLYPELEPLEGYVNNKLPQLDIRKVFENPDNDPIEYKITCTNDPTHSFEFEVNNDVITFHGGMKPGTFEVEIQATDPDMVTPVSDTVTLIVEDRVPVVEKIPNDRLGINCYSFQKNLKQSSTLDLSDYIYDPDGVKMTYILEMDSAILDIAQNGAILEIKPVGEGDTTVKIAGNDGVSDVTAEFKVTVKDGRVIFWEDNWIYFALALAVIVAIILTIIILVKNKLVKGEWEITLDDNGNVGKISNINIADYTSVGKNRKFLLSDLVIELLPYLDYPMSSENIASYFVGNGSDEIQFKGVVRRKGCAVIKIPADNSGTTVSNDGVPAKGKTDLRQGTLTFTIVSTDGLGRKLRFSMRLL